MLEIKNLKIKYDKNIVLDDVNLVFDKKIYGLQGSSGSGKTSFIKALLGLIKYEGQILLNDKILKNRKKFQVVFQNPFNSFDSKRKIKFSIFEIMKLNDIKTDLKDFAYKVGVDYEFLEKYPTELSGGELQRCSILRALISNPEIIIFDEPTSALDVENQKNILDLIKSIKDKIIILISHDKRVINYVCDEKLFLDKEKRKIINLSV